MLIHIDDIEEPDSKELVQIISEEERKNKHQRVKNIITYLIIIPYIILLISNAIGWEITIPKAYETIALIIIGYYFTKIV